MKTILYDNDIQLIIKRLAHQLIESNADRAELYIIGIQPRGVFFSNQLVNYIRQTQSINVQYGQLDITFYRDDIRKSLHLPNNTKIDFNIENKKVIIVDDVLFTGRTIRAALDALMDFGRPQKVELCVLIDRRLSREVPIQPDYFGRTIDTYHSEKVKVHWAELDGENKVVIQ